MSMLHAIIIAIVQGATELFPVSSLGHAVILPSLLNWGIDQGSQDFLPFLVLLHTGTAAALLIYFWRDWLRLLLGIVGAVSHQETASARRLFLLIVIATIPAVILGYALNHLFRQLFASPLYACGFLVLNGILLIAVERLRSTAGSARTLQTMSVADAVTIGLWQCGALLPGISRSGATIAGGLLRGLNHVDAARFSFLIALPIIVGATVLEVPHLLRAGVPPEVFQQAALAAIIAGITAFLATAFLMRYFKGNDNWALTPFAIYCILFGGAAGAYILAS